MRKLRRFMNDSDTAMTYAHKYNSNQWPEHKERIRRTTQIVQDLFSIDETCTRITDLSCGDGTIIDGIIPGDRCVWFDKQDRSLGGASIEETSKTCNATDILICTETIEHLREPWTVLEQIALKTKWLVLSTPLDEDPSIGNYEHYWSFSKRDIAELLEQSGFAHADLTYLHDPMWTYTYQIWTAISNVGNRRRYPDASAAQRQGNDSEGDRLCAQPISSTDRDLHLQRCASPRCTVRETASTDDEYGTVDSVPGQ